MYNSSAYFVFLMLVSVTIGCSKSYMDKTSPLDKKNLFFEQSSVNTMAAQSHSVIKLFDGGSEGNHSYRIPSIIKTKKGSLVAITEGRRWSNEDFGDINILFKRSVDNGKTWSSLGTIASSGNGTWGNPTALCDPHYGTNGRLWVFMNWNDETIQSNGDVDKWGERRVYSSYSDDDGISWSKPKDMTSTLLPPNYTWDAIGPGVGIVTRVNRPGRLIIPATGRNIYSDDHGANWKYQLIPGGTSEGTIVELMNGKLMRNDRPTSVAWEISKRRRISSGSIEGGFSNFLSDATLYDPKCEGAILRYNTDNPHRIVFLNSASTKTRGKMRVRISYDDGKTWPVSRRIYDWLTEEDAVNQGKGGYSSMVKTNDYHIGALIEINEDRGNDNSNRSIDFHRFNLPWILNEGNDPI